MRALWFKTLSRLREFLKTKQRILDTGTELGGMLTCLHITPRAVHAIDAGRSVFQAYQDLTARENHNVVQADLTRSRFASRLIENKPDEPQIDHKRKWRFRNS
jgi:hypothetical protein